MSTGNVHIPCLWPTQRPTSFVCPISCTFTGPPFFWHYSQIVRWEVGSGRGRTLPEPSEAPVSWLRPTLNPAGAWAPGFRLPTENVSCSTLPMPWVTCPFVFLGSLTLFHLKIPLVLKNRIPAHTAALEPCGAGARFFHSPARVPSSCTHRHRAQPPMDHNQGRHYSPGPQPQPRSSSIL